HRILERARARRHGVHLGAKHVHARDVRRLTGDIRRTHVYLAGKPEAGAHRRHRNAMLTGTRLGDDTRLTHTPRELDLAEAVVDLVAACVIELVALEVDLGAPATGGRRNLTKVLRQALGEI